MLPTNKLPHSPEAPDASDGARHPVADQTQPTFRLERPECAMIRGGTESATPEESGEAEWHSYLVDIGFSSLGNPGPSAWVARITRSDGASKTISEVYPHVTNAAVAAYAYLGVLKVLPHGAPGRVRSRDKEGIETINTRLPVWGGNGWRTSKNKPVKNRDIWIKVSGARVPFSELSFEWSDGTDSMSAIVETEARKLAEAEKLRVASL